MSENIQKLNEAVKGNEELQKKFEAAGEDVNAILAIAKEAGFNLTAADIEAAKSGKVSDDDLEDVAGGAHKIEDLDSGGLKITVYKDDWTHHTRDYLNSIQGKLHELDTTPTLVLRALINKVGETYWLFQGYCWNNTGSITIQSGGRIH